MRKTDERLRDILEAIERIEKYHALGHTEFVANELIQNWMVHHLQIIGEAIRGLPPQFREQHPQIPWAQVIGMRNILVHDYFGVNLNIVWNAVVDDLPPLKRSIQELIGNG